MRRVSVLIVLAVAALSLIAATATPFVSPTLPPSPTAVCSPAPPSRLILDMRGRVSTVDPRPLNMRDGAGTAAHVIAQIPTGGVFYVLEGPQCSQNYAWYRVEYQGIDGWIAEGDSTGYYVEPYPPGW